MIDPQSLQFLRCPVSKSRLEIASSPLVEWLNRQIQAGKCIDSAGNAVDASIDDALINEAKTLAMPIRSGVISLSADRTISIHDFTD